VTQPATEMRRLVGKFALLLAFVYVLVLMAGVFRAVRGPELPALGWVLFLVPGAALVALADKAVIAGISAGLGTVTAETGVGAVAGYGVAGLLVVQMLELVNRASTIINTAGTVILGLFGGAADLAYQGGGDLSAVPLPAVAYSAPGA
jgi:hypothetical protein